MNARQPALAAPTLTLLAAAVLTAAPAYAHSSLVGGFRPVAAEYSSRALWVNPAAIGASGRGTATLEILATDAEAFWAEDSDGLQFPTDPLGASFAASTDRAAYGYQKELDDQAGVPSWTMAFGNRAPLGGRAFAGATVEYRGGDDSGFDGTLGLLVPLSATIQVAAVLDNVLASRVDGVDGARRWQFGAAVRSRRQPFRLSWDLVRDGDLDSVHWWALGVDQIRRVGVSFARSSEGDWNATFDFALPNHRIGVGAAERSAAADRPHRAFLAAEWSGNTYPGSSGRSRR